MKLTPNLLQEGDVVRASISVEDLPPEARGGVGWGKEKRKWLESGNTARVYRILVSQLYGRHIRIQRGGCTFVMREHELERVRTE